ncbi:MAG: heme-copper oxidase subunit III [bacterium]|jgi:cytochrome c oxidase subunit 3
MMASIDTKVQQDKFNPRPVKFILWLFILSSIMLFAGITSAYIVRQAEGNWKIFDLPSMFYYTTVLILLSSATMHWSYLQAKKFNLRNQKIGLWITFVLGVAFLIGQYQGWKELVNSKVFFSGNPAESFVYVISGFHAVHIIAGLIIMLTAMIGVHSNINQTKNVFRMELSSVFWHFIDILWIYLFVFLMINR